MYSYLDITENIQNNMSKENADILYNAASNLAPKVIVEIGINDACTSLVLGNVARENEGRLYVIDPKLPDAWETEVERLGLSEWITVIDACSPWLLPEQMEQIPKSIDFLFVGGNYLTMQIIANYHYWQKYVRRGGKIGFNDWVWHHDIINHTHRAVDIIWERGGLGKVDTHRDVIVFTKGYD